MLHKGTGISVHSYVRLLFICLILFGCQTKHNLKPSDTIFLQTNRNWEAVYEKELKIAIFYDDYDAFRFFWPLYLQERTRNKCKLYNTFHNVNCDCLNK